MAHPLNGSRESLSFLGYVFSQGTVLTTEDPKNHHYLDMTVQWKNEEEKENLSLRSVSSISDNPQAILSTSSSLIDQAARAALGELERNGLCQKTIQRLQEQFRSDQVNQLCFYMPFTFYENLTQEFRTMVCLLPHSPHRQLREISLPDHRSNEELRFLGHTFSQVVVAKKNLQGHQIGSLPLLLRNIPEDLKKNILSVEEEFPLPEFQYLKDAIDTLAPQIEAFIRGQIGPWTQGLSEEIQQELEELLKDKNPTTLVISIQSMSPNLQNEVRGIACLSASDE